MQIRGQPFKEVTLEWAVRLGAAIGKAAGPGSLVISGRDVAPASRMFKRAITAGVMSAGAEVLDFHESTTGEIAFAIKRFGGKYGFMVSRDVLSSKGIAIRLFKTPGYELAEREVRGLLEEAEKGIEEPRKIGWVNYAEYMHKLYAAALVSFVKFDIIANSRISAAVAPDVQPLNIILRNASTELAVRQVSIGAAQVEACEYPCLSLAEEVEKVSNAVRASIGVLFSYDGSSLALYSELTGYLVPDELVLLLSRRYSPGSKILLLEPVRKPTVKILEESGFDVVVARGEDEFSRALRRERPAFAFTPVGEFSTPLFSLGPDALATYVQVLEALAEQSTSSIAEAASKTRLQAEVVSVDVATSVCKEKGQLTLLGCVISEDGKVVYLTYQPRAQHFLKTVDQAA